MGLELQHYTQKPGGKMENIHNLRAILMKWFEIRKHCSCKLGLLVMTFIQSDRKQTVEL